MTIRVFLLFLFLISALQCPAAADIAGMLYAQDSTSNMMMDAQLFFTLKQQAEDGYPGAQCQVGECYEKGWFVSKDLTNAFFWYQQAAEQGDPWAQTASASCIGMETGFNRTRWNPCIGLKRRRNKEVPPRNSTWRHATRAGWGSRWIPVVPLTCIDKRPRLGMPWGSICLAIVTK